MPYKVWEIGADIYVFHTPIDTSTVRNKNIFIHETLQRKDEPFVIAVKKGRKAADSIKTYLISREGDLHASC